MIKKTVTALGVAALAGAGSLALLPDAQAKSSSTAIEVAACKPCNPCKAKNPCNPCAAKNPCNPCAAKNPCNPCAAKNPCAGKNPCNPCAAKKSN